MSKTYESDVDPTDGIMNLQILNQPVVEGHEFNLKDTVQNAIKNAVKEYSPSNPSQNLVMVLFCKDGRMKKVLRNDWFLKDYAHDFGEGDLMKIMPDSEAPSLPESHVEGFKLKIPKKH